MRVNRKQLACKLRANLRTPDQCPLLEQVTVGLWGVLQSKFFTAGSEETAESDDGNAEPAQVADVLAQGEAAIDTGQVSALLGLLAQCLRHQSLVLIDQCGGQLLKSCAILIGPPLVEVAVPVILRALVIKTMPNLVTNNGTDTTEVLRRGSVR